MMWCAECGNPLQKPSYDLGWLACCNGNGYWSKDKPLPKDIWWPVTKWKDFYFYFNVKWPAGKEPIKPIEN